MSSYRYILPGLLASVAIVGGWWLTTQPAPQSRPQAVEKNPPAALSRVGQDLRRALGKKEVAKTPQQQPSASSFPFLVAGEETGELPEALPSASDSEMSEEVAAAEAEILANLRAAGVPAADIEETLTAILPDSQMTEEETEGGTEELDLSDAELEAEILANLQAAGVPAADIEETLTAILPDSQMTEETPVDEDELITNLPIP